MSRMKLVCMVLGVAFTLVACGGEEATDERDDLESLEGKADIPSWLVKKTGSPACGESLAGKFAGSDSAHMYSFAATAGTTYTFKFKATYAASKGAAIAVYDGATGKRLKLSTSKTSNQSTAKLTAASSATWMIAVYSVASSATGSYTITTQCDLGASGSVTLTTDKKSYKLGEAVAAKISNGTPASIFLPGCSAFSWEKQESGAWVSKGPDVVCVWEGVAKEVKAGKIFTGSPSLKDVGTWRLRSDYGVGCTASKPISQAGCASTKTVTSVSFTVTDCPKLMPPAPSFCPNGKIVPRYDSDKICITGYNCVTTCQVSDCGPALGMPNKLCADGKTVSGPTGKCIMQAGECGWEVVTCPAIVCRSTGCSGQLCADTDIATTCDWHEWYSCYAKSECGAFGANGACAWKETSDYVTCMKSYGK
jgi:eight-cysteine-cluster-containing protein